MHTCMLQANTSDSMLQKVTFPIFCCRACTSISLHTRSTSSPAVRREREETRVNTILLILESISMQELDVRSSCILKFYDFENYGNPVHVHSLDTVQKEMGKDSTQIATYSGYCFPKIVFIMSSDLQSDGAQ